MISDDKWWLWWWWWWLLLLWLMTIIYLFLFSLFWFATILLLIFTIVIMTLPNYYVVIAIFKPNHLAFPFSPWSPDRLCQESRPKAESDALRGTRCGRRHGPPRLALQVSVWASVWWFLDDFSMNLTFFLNIPIGETVMISEPQTSRTSWVDACPESRRFCFWVGWCPFETMEKFNMWRQ